MSDTKRVTFTYDTKYDKEIERALSAVPERRRSERIRQLLLQGIRAETRIPDEKFESANQEGQTNIEHDTEKQLMKIDEAGEKDTAIHDAENVAQQSPVIERRRPIVRFKPPTNNL